MDKLVFGFKDAKAHKVTAVINKRAELACRFMYATL